MKKFAVVKIAGFQYKVAEGDEIEVNRLKEEKGKEIFLEEILLLAQDDKIKIGQPLVKDVKIKAKIVDQFKGKKIRIATYKAKSRYRKVKGFRPFLTKIKIEKIASS
ncbi:MAG: 50S ribosomal protein L21 [Candidatus Shapirobacteria bacterium]|nr:50S ribosomal protein L21 [Candidatus Shapirobacteria bacterium]